MKRGEEKEIRKQRRRNRREKWGEGTGRTGSDGWRERKRRRRRTEDESEERKRKGLFVLPSGQKFLRCRENWPQSVQHIRLISVTSHIYKTHLWKILKTLEALLS